MLSERPLAPVACVFQGIALFCVSLQGVGRWFVGWFGIFCLFVLFLELINCSLSKGPERGLDVVCNPSWGGETEQQPTSHSICSYCPGFQAIRKYLNSRNVCLNSSPNISKSFGETIHLGC